MKFTQPVWPRFLPTPAVYSLAMLGPLGRLPAPGTWGSLAGWLYFVVVFLRFGGSPAHPFESPAALFIATILLSLFGGYLAVALCGEAEFRLGVRDPGGVILDEFVAMPLCFLGLPQLVHALPEALRVGAVPLALLIVSAAGLALFRLFDIAKPFGIAKLQDLPGGWGIVADDIAAALATCLVLHLGLGLWVWLR
jgi:phosphatidylglycerophosphatase A